MGPGRARFAFRLRTLLVAVAASAVMLAGVGRLIKAWDREDRRQLVLSERKLAAGWQALWKGRQEKEERARLRAAVQRKIAAALRRRSELMREREEARHRLDGWSRRHEEIGA